MTDNDFKDFATVLFDQIMHGHYTNPRKTPEEIISEVQSLLKNRFGEKSISRMVEQGGDI